MPASKLKNLVILILALANILLLALVLPAQRELARQTRQEKVQIAALFEEAGVTLDAADIPDASALYPMEAACARDAQIAAVQALLGAPVTQTSHAYSTEFFGAWGRGMLEDSGEAALFFGGTTAAEDTQADAAERLKRTLLACTAPRLSADGQTVTAYLTVGGAPVFTEPLTFTYKNGTLIRFSALMVCAGSTVRTDKTPCISAQDALLAFYGSRMETGWIGSRITGIAQGYTAKTAVQPQTLALTPCWRIETDTGAFLVDGITAAVSAA